MTFTTSARLGLNRVASHINKVVGGRTFASGRRTLMTTVSKRARNVEEVADSEPTKFSTSGAQKWQSVDSFAAPPKIQQTPKAQPIIVALSTAIFLIYFTMLREENDIDESISRSLFDNVPGLEEGELRRRIEFNRSQGKSTVDLEKRLREISN